MAFLENEVHLWRVLLARASSEREVQMLSTDERARAGRLRVAEHRAAFIVCRATLRTILAEYLGSGAAEIVFRYSEAGKPEVASGSATAALCFNVAHSGDYGIIALSPGRRVGVDLERMRDDFDLLATAQSSFSRAEVSALEALEPVRRMRGFFACWTRKEAFLKARGDGLSSSLSLSDFAVSVDPDEPARVVHVRDTPPAGINWSLTDLNIADGYRAALAVEGPLPAIRQREWTGKP